MRYSGDQAGYLPRLSHTGPWPPLLERCFFERVICNKRLQHGTAAPGLSPFSILIRSAIQYCLQHDCLLICPTCPAVCDRFAADIPQRAAGRARMCANMPESGTVLIAIKRDKLLRKRFGNWSCNLKQITFKWYTRHMVA